MKVSSPGYNEKNQTFLFNVVSDEATKREPNIVHGARNIIQPLQTLLVKNCES